MPCSPLQSASSLDDAASYQTNRRAPEHAAKAPILSKAHPCPRAGFHIILALRPSKILAAKMAHAASKRANGLCGMTM